MIIVSRHAATVEWLREQGYEGQVIAHIANPEQIAGEIVIGNLPLHLAARAALVGAVEFELPAEMRGQELTLEWLRENASVRWYTVQSESPERYYEAIREAEAASEAYAWRGSVGLCIPRQKADSLSGAIEYGDRESPSRTVWSQYGGPDGPDDE